MKKIKILTLLIIASTLVGCTNREIGTAVGSVSGFMIGSAIGDGTIGAGVGTAIGAMAGNAIGSSSER